jgi:hypothetical protein
MVPGLTARDREGDMSKIDVKEMIKEMVDRIMKHTGRDKLSGSVQKMIKEKKDDKAN